MRTRLKICCISSVAEARLAVQSGADALGLVSAMPSGPGPIPEEQIAEIVATVPPPIATFLLTCATEPAIITAQLQRTRCNTVQLVDAVPESVYRALRETLPTVKIVQVIHVTGPESVEEALATTPFIDALLLDSGNPNLPVKELGGTGRIHDWSLSRAIVERSPVPVFLAGGLNADNAAQAIAHVGPFGLDLCSSVRTNGALDADKLGRFIAATRTERYFAGAGAPDFP